MKKALIYHGGDTVPYIVCPLIQFERGVGSCMTSCEESEVCKCPKIKTISIEELDAAALLLNKEQVEQWEERRDFFVTPADEGGGGVMPWEDTKGVETEAPGDEEDEAPDDPGEKDGIPAGPYDEPETDDYPKEVEDGPGEEPDASEDENKKGETKMADEPEGETPDQQPKKKRKQRSDKGKKKKGGKAEGQPDPDQGDMYVLVCEGEARILENKDPDDLLKEVKDMGRGTAEKLKERAEEMIEDGKDGEARELVDTIASLESGEGVRIFQVSSELKAEVRVELIRA